MSGRRKASPQNENTMSATRKRLGQPKANWENGFAALTKFKAREGHCRVPALHIERKYRLGQWVSQQQMSADTLSPKHRKRLNAIGFVWNRREDAWERGFAVLTKFKAYRGHCLVPRFHILRTYKLGHPAAQPVRFAGGHQPLRLCLRSMG
jgi:hypothetical protein